MHAMRTGSETFLKAIFGKSNEQKEEPAWGWLYDADRQLDGAEAKGCLVFFLPFFFFIKENDLGTAERRSNMAKRREIPRRGERRTQRSESKRMFFGAMRREAAPPSQKTWVGILPLPHVPASLWVSVSTLIYLFSACQLRLKHLWR